MATTIAEIKPEERTFPAMVARAARLFADKIAIQEDTTAITYQQLLEQSRRAAKAFMASGIEKGDRVAIWAPNVSEWIVAALGIHSAGAVLVPMNTRDKGPEAAYKINAGEIKMLCTLEEFNAGGGNAIRYVDMLEGQQLPGLNTIICLRGEAPGAIAWQSFLTRAEQISDAELEQRLVSVSPDDIADMLFTSGTTGKPKMVMCTHGQDVQVFATWAETVGLRSDDNYLCINPFFHTFGYKAGWLASIIMGATLFPVLTFDLDVVLKQIARDKISMIPGPPTIYQSLLVHPDRDQYDLSSLRLAVTGAAAVPVELIRRMSEELHFETVVTAYGLTESCGVVSICRPDDSPETISHTSGRAIPGIEVKCVDASGEEVSRGEPGEVWVRGYNVMQGYFNNPEASRETITEDGWLKTGDVAVMDEGGYLRITDRIKDMYISGGFNVYPAEIENALSSLEGVAQVAVIGVEHERMGEIGKAYIVKAPGAELTEASVLGWCKENLANYKVPKIVEFIDAMPLNAAGKILKTTLREWSRSQA